MALYLPQQRLLAKRRLLAQRRCYMAGSCGGGGLLQGNELLQVGDVPRVRKELNFTQRNVERIQQLLVAYKQERDILQEMLEDNLKVDRQRNIEFETILASDCVVVVAVENILG